MRDGVHRNRSRANEARACVRRGRLAVIALAVAFAASLLGAGRTEAACSTAPDPVVWLVDDTEDLISVTVPSGTQTTIGDTNRTFFDIGWGADSLLYGVDTDDDGLYRINTTTAATTFIGTLNARQLFVNALTFGADGTGWAAGTYRPSGSSTRSCLFSFNPADPGLTTTCRIDFTGVLSSLGDLAWVSNTLIYFSAEHVPTGREMLISLNPTAGTYTIRLNARANGKGAQADVRRLTVVELP